MRIAWFGNEGTQNIGLMELHVIPNVCSEYSEQKIQAIVQHPLQVRQSLRSKVGNLASSTKTIKRLNYYKV